METNENAILEKQEVFIIDGARTPFLKAQKGLGPFSGSTLAVKCSQALLKQLNLDKALVNEVIVGSAMPGPDEANIARIIALRLGLKQNVPAWTVMRNCASGMQAIDNASQSIAMGRSDMVLAIL